MDAPCLHAAGATHLVSAAISARTRLRSALHEELTIQAELVTATHDLGGVAWYRLAIAHWHIILVPRSWPSADVNVAFQQAELC